MECSKYFISQEVLDKHPRQFADSPALAYRNGRMPPTPSELAAAREDTSTTF